MTIVIIVGCNPSSKLLRGSKPWGQGRYITPENMVVVVSMNINLFQVREHVVAEAPPLGVNAVLLHSNHAIVVCGNFCQVVLQCLRPWRFCHPFFQIDGAPDARQKVDSRWRLFLRRYMSNFLDHGWIWFWKQTAQQKHKLRSMVVRMMVIITKYDRW